MPSKETASWSHLYLTGSLLFPPTRTGALFETNVNAFSDRRNGCRDQLRVCVEHMVGANDYMSDAKCRGIKSRMRRLTNDDNYILFYKSLQEFCQLWLSQTYVFFAVVTNTTFLLESQFCISPQVPMCLNSRSRISLTYYDNFTQCCPLRFVHYLEYVGKVSHLPWKLYTDISRTAGSLMDEVKLAVLDPDVNKETTWTMSPKSRGMTMFSHATTSALTMAPRSKYQ